MYNIFLVEDHPTMRQALVRLLKNEPDLTTCGEAATVPEALAQIPACAPDLVLVDVSLAEMDGLALIKRLLAQNPHLLCLVVSGHNEATYAQAALQAGARGYVMKGDPPALLKAIRSVLHGELYLSEAMRETLLMRSEK
jgi:DNA-binding NarL/FixJ family response regulator